MVLAYQTKGFADNVIPYQQISTSLWNSAMASKRRLVYDRWVSTILRDQQNRYRQS